jgi:phosphate transport system substrate-binding protein
MNKLGSPLAIALGLGLSERRAVLKRLNNSSVNQSKLMGQAPSFPITDAIANAYNETQPDPVEVDVSFSGTGGGFEKFCAGETDISNASRPILEAEMAACNEAGIRFYELPVAFDALTIVVNQENDWAGDITVEELNTLWEPGAQGKVTRWNQVRPSWPDTTYCPPWSGLRFGDLRLLCRSNCGPRHPQRLCC